MKQRKATRKSGSTPRTAKATAPKRKTVGAVALPAECAIASVSSLRATLLERVSDSGKVQIDASSVQRIDTASLQVLAAFARDRRAEERPTEWVGVPACLTDAANLLDLTDALGIGSPGSTTVVQA
jgi:ABC-type transporter Mla MlaB component